MTNDQIDKLLSKIPSDKIYEDLLHPSLSKVGQVLSDVFDMGNLILLPFKLVNEKSKIFLRKNLEDYAQKLSKIDDDDLCNVPVQIGLEIVDKLTILEKNELSEIFLNLLTKASSSKTQNLVHPAFISILNNLSQDEAIMLMAMKSKEIFPFIDVYISKKGHLRGVGKAYMRVAYNLTGMENDLKLYFPENIDIYLENLEKSGIIEFDRSIYNENDNEEYEKLISEHYSEVILEAEKAVKLINEDDDLNFKSSISLRKCQMKFTEFGTAFLKAVILEIDELQVR